MGLQDRVPAADVTLPAGALAGGVLAWWTATVLLAVPPFVLPSPVAVGERLIDSPGLYLRNAVATLAKVLVGGAVGGGGGVLVAVAVAKLPPVRRALFPYLVAARVLPKIAIAPVLLLYLGIGFETAVLFVAAVAFFPMAVSTAAGLERTPERQRDLLRSVNAGPLRTFLTVELPFALPDVFAGLKQSVTLAVVGAVIAEWIVATDGLGYLVLVGSETVQVAVMLAALAVLVVLGVALYGAVALVQRRLAWPDGA